MIPFCAIVLSHRKNERFQLFDCVFPSFYAISGTTSAKIELLIVCLRMHWKRKVLVYRIRFDASDCITCAMQILWCHSKLKVKTMDGWLTKVHSNWFIVVERQTLAVQVAGNVGFISSVCTCCRLSTMENNKKLKDRKIPSPFPRKAFLSSPRNQFFDLFPVFIRKNNLQVLRIATKDAHNGNMFNFHSRIFLRKRRIFSFPRNQACVWKVALASSEKWSVFCCPVGVCTHLVFKEKNCNKNGNTKRLAYNR